MINPSLNVIASWAVAVAQALDVRGVDSTAIFPKQELTWPLPGIPACAMRRIE